MLLIVAAAALTVIVGLGAWAIGESGSGGGASPGGDPRQTSSSAQPTPQATRLAVQDVTPAELSPQGRHDTAIGENLDVVHDGEAGDVWETQTYADVDFGNLAEGLGVMLDLGKTAEISSVRVATPEGGGTIQVKVGDRPDVQGQTALGSQRTNAGETTIQTSDRVRGRYVLVWFTQLPPDRKGKISEVTVYGIGR